MANCSDVRPVEDRKELVESTAMAKGTVSPGPCTPDANREIGDFPYDCNSPPTDVKKPAIVPCFVRNADTNQDPFGLAHLGSPRTPDEGVFDPFAPGPHDMVLAPLCKKYIDGKRNIVARRLNFDTSPQDMNCGSLSVDVESVSDQELLESVYRNLLDVVISIQTEAFLAEMSERKRDSDSCKTPLTLRINGVAETCPAAPIKPSGRSRNIDLGLCKKLEF